MHGLLTLHAATQDDRWLNEAKRLTDAMIDRFEDKEAGGFFYVSHDHEKLFARSKDQYDGVTPSANSTAALNLVRLAQKTRSPRYREQAVKVMEAFAPAMIAQPSGLTAMARAAALWFETEGGVEAAPPGEGQKARDVVAVTAIAPGVGQSLALVRQLTSVVPMIRFHALKSPGGKEVP